MKWQYILLLTTVLLFNSCFRAIKGEGVSESKGKVNNGELINGRKSPWKGENFKYFSKASYHLLNRA